MWCLPGKKLEGWAQRVTVNGGKDGWRLVTSGGHQDPVPGLVVDLEVLGNVLDGLMGLFQTK